MPNDPKTKLAFLQQAMMGMVPNMPPYKALAEMNKLVKAEQMAQAMKGQAAMQQAQGMRAEPPVAVQVAQKAQQLDQGIGNQPYGYAGGGIVAFAEGGKTKTQEEIDRESMLDTIRKMTAAGMDVATLIPRAGLAVGEGTITRSLRALGVPVPYLPEDVYGGNRASMTPFMDKLRLEKSRAAPGPGAPKDTAAGDFQRSDKDTSQVAVPDGYIPGRGLEALVRPVAPGAGGPRGPGGPVGPRPGAYDALGRAVADLKAKTEEGGKIDPSVLEARKGVDAAAREAIEAQRAERERVQALAEKRMQEAKDRNNRPILEDVTALGKMLSGMKGAKRFGEGLAGAAAGAGQAVGDREKALAAATEKYDLTQKELFTIDNARRQLERAQAELVEARASGDSERVKKASVAVAELERAYQATLIDLQFKREAADTERLKAQAALESARNRGGDADWKEKIARMKADGAYKGVVEELKIATELRGTSPTSKSVQERYARAVAAAQALAARYGLDKIEGVDTPAPAASNAGAAPPGFKVTPR